MELEQRRRIASLLPPCLCIVEQNGKLYLARMVETEHEGSFGCQIISSEIHFGNFDEVEQYLQIIKK